MPKRTGDHHSWLLEQISDPRFAADYLNEARKESTSALLKALRNVAEARRIAVVAESTGLNRESLYKSLSEDGNPRLKNFDSVIEALGLDYDFKPREIEAQGLPPNHTKSPERTVINTATTVEITGQGNADASKNYYFTDMTPIGVQVPQPVERESELVAA